MSKQRSPLRRLLPLIFLGLFGLVLLAGCSGSDDPTPEPTATPAGAQATPVPTAGGPGGTFDDLELRVFGPVDGSAVETGAVRVVGSARPDAIVAVNGVPVDLGADGMFTADVDLAEGINEIEVIATDIAGNTESVFLVVFGATAASALPLSVFFPRDGLLVRTPEIEVTGSSRQDAIVGVNGIPADVEASGIFTATVSLVEGANLIEIVAADLANNVSFQTTVVFYQP